MSIRLGPSNFISFLGQKECVGGHSPELSGESRERLAKYSGWMWHSGRLHIGALVVPSKTAGLCSGPQSCLVTYGRHQDPPRDELLPRHNFKHLPLAPPERGRDPEKLVRGTWWMLRVLPRGRARAASRTRGYLPRDGPGTSP